MPNQFNGLESPPPWNFTRALGNVDLGNYNISNVGLINGVTPGSGGSGISNLSQWAQLPALSNIQMNNNSILACCNVQTSLVNGTVYEPISNWSFHPATNNVNLSNRNILNVGNIQASTINNIQLSGQSFQPSNWSAYVANQTVNLGNNNLTSGGSLSTNSLIATNLTIANINGLPYSQSQSPSNWSLFPCLNTIQMNSNSIANCSNIETNFINNLPIANVALWSQNVATQSVNIGSNSIVNATNIQCSTVNGVSIPQTFSASSWSQFPATGITNFAFNTLSNCGTILAQQLVTTSISVSNINGSPYTPGQTPSTWSEFVALTDVNFGGRNITNCATIFANELVLIGILGSNATLQSANIQQLSCSNLSVNGQNFIPPTLYNLTFSERTWFGDGTTIPIYQDLVNPGVPLLQLSYRFNPVEVEIQFSAYNDDVNNDIVIAWGVQIGADPPIRNTLTYAIRNAPNQDAEFYIRTGGSCSFLIPSQNGLLRPGKILCFSPRFPGTINIIVRPIPTGYTPMRIDY